MKRIAIAVVALSAVAIGAQGASIILDPSFETPALASGTAQYDPGGSDWNFAGRAGLSNDGWTTVTPPDGLQVAFLQGFGGMGATISQELTGLIVGDTYQFGFYLAMRPGGYTPNSIDVLLDSADLGTFAPASTDFAQFTSAPVIATSSAMNLQFVGSIVSTDDVDSFLDLVQVNDLGSTAPEPGTFGIAAGAVFALAMMCWRRRAPDAPSR